MSPKMINQIFSLLQNNWKTASAIALFTVLAFFFRRLGNKLQTIRSQRLIFLWLNEIGSDVRLYGFATSLALALSYWANIYAGNFAWAAPLGIAIAKLSLSFWGILSAIAFLEVAQPFYSRVVEQSDIMSAVDKQNILTLIPVLASGLKIVIYSLGMQYCSVKGR
jgi:hypothetical protein